MTRAERLRAWEHLRQLAHDHRVVMYPTVSRWKAEAHVDRRVIYVPRTMRAPIDYLVALHELGHVCSPLARRLFTNDDLQREVACEGAAWMWAVEHAEPDLLDLLSARGWALVGEALVAYLQYGRPDSVPA